MYIIDKLINSLTKEGKRQQALNHVYSAFETLKFSSRKSVNGLAEIIESNCLSVIELIQPNSRGKKVKVPSFLSFVRSKRLAMKFLANSCLKGSLKNGLTNRILAELNNALENKGSAVHSKHLIYQFILNNKVFWRRIFSKHKRRKKRRRRKKIKRF